jgi:high-affinity iron transporter
MWPAIGAAAIVLAPLFALLASRATAAVAPAAGPASLAAAATLGAGLCAIRELAIPAVGVLAVLLLCGRRARVGARRRLAPAAARGLLVALAVAGAHALFPTTLLATAARVGAGLGGLLQVGGASLSWWVAEHATSQRQWPRWTSAADVVLCGSFVQTLPALLALVEALRIAVALTGATGATAAGASTAVLLLGTLLALTWRLGRSGAPDERRRVRALAVVASASATVSLGHAVLALQRGGWVALTAFDWAPLPLLGLYPSLEGVAAQVIGLGATMALWARAGRDR